MKSVSRWVGLAALTAAVLSGCTVFHAFLPSSPGRAYVVATSTITGSSRVLNCDATGGQPHCWTVNER